MTDSAEREEPVFLVIPQPPVRRVVAIAAIVIFLTFLAILPAKLGLQRFFESLTHFSATWVVIFMFGPPIALFARLAFPPRSSLPRLEVSRTGIRIVPGRIARLCAETPVEIALTPQSSEILLCHCAWQGMADGLRLVVRAADGTEREIRATSMDYLSATDAQKLAIGVSASTGLPVRVLARRRHADGTIREDLWIPSSSRTKMASSAALAMGGIPLVGGAVVGLLWPRPALIVVVGLGLWICQMGVLWGLGRYLGSRARFTTPYSLTTIFTFAAAYGVAVVVVGSIIRSR